jgi:hypothetical protein
LILGVVLSLAAGFAILCVLWCHFYHLYSLLIQYVPGTSLEKKKVHTVCVSIIMEHY